MDRSGTMYSVCSEDFLLAPTHSKVKNKLFDTIKTINENYLGFPKIVIVTLRTF